MSNSLGMITRGPALSEEHGAHLGRGMGEQTGAERTVANGSRSNGQQPDHAGHGEAMPQPSPQHGGHGSIHGADTMARLVPGYPQDMMDMMGMYSESVLTRIIKPQTRGMRKDWYRGVEGLMTVLRVLPDELYDQVMSGEGDIAPGASVPGADAGSLHQHKH